MYNVFVMFLFQFSFRAKDENGIAQNFILPESTIITFTEMSE